MVFVPGSHDEIRDVDGVANHNCGDWIENNSGRIGRFDGQSELLFWIDRAPDAVELLAGEASSVVGQPS